MLRIVARVLRAQVRVTDYVARYGGEEFAVILPGTNAQGAMILAERLRAAIESTHWPERNVTASFGVASLPPSGGNEVLLIAAADRALYASKAGRAGTRSHLRRSRIRHCPPKRSLHGKSAAFARFVLSLRPGLPPRARRCVDRGDRVQITTAGASVVLGGDFSAGASYTRRTSEGRRGLDPIAANSISTMIVRLHERTRSALISTAHTFRFPESFRCTARPFCCPRC